MRRLVFGLGSLQVVLSTPAIAGVAAARRPASRPRRRSSAACLALSSTAIVIEVLSNQGRLTTSAGRTSFAVLLAQDLAVVPILLFVSILGANAGGSVLADARHGACCRRRWRSRSSCSSAALLLRPLFRLVAGTRVERAVHRRDPVRHRRHRRRRGGWPDLSMALGAFVAGLLLAETEYRKAIEATIEPFKGLLLGIFFFTVGMNIDLRELAREPLLAAGLRSSA